MRNDIAFIRDTVINALCKKKLIAEDDIKNAVQVHKEKGGALSDILVGMGVVSRADLVSVLSEELKIPAIDLARYKISDEILKLIPKKIAKNYHVLPVSRIGNLLTIALTDPLNVLAIDDITTITGCKVSVVIVSDKDIDEAICEYYEGGTHEAIEKIIGDMEESGDMEMLDVSEESISQEQLIKLVQEAPIVKITDAILAEAVKMRASDILIEPQEDVIRVRYRIDGLLVEAQRPPKKIHAAIISRLKVISNLNIAERRLPQDGRFKIRTQNRQVDFRISVIPSSKGEKVALRILDKNQAMLDLDKLGFEEGPLSRIKESIQKPHGMILSCGPTGCGKTTTLYSILKYIDSPEKNILTAEDPVEYQLEGINQLAVRPELGLTFASSLRSFLRQDPDIIMVGEIRDFETVDISIKAALTGHLVLSTLHTTTASGSIIRLINMGVEPFLITSSMVLILAQRLVRKICENCKEPYQISEVVAKKLQIKEGSQRGAFKGIGCQACNKTGYKGRIGLVEALALTPNIKKLILGMAQDSEIKEAARREGMATLRENGIMKVQRGVTTLEEILRVTVGDQDIVI
ncbi:MAG: ATPase, T2SS/T4P/T4SS family [Candidatus Omnitrophota bacterium]